MYISCCYKLLIIDADYLYHCFSWNASNEFVRGEERQLVQSDGRGRCRLITSVSHFHFVSILGESCQLMGFFFILDESCHRSLWHFEHVWCCVKINHKFLKVKMLNDQWSISSQLYMKIPQEFTPNLTELFKIDFWTITSWWKKYILERKRLRGS